MGGAAGARPIVAYALSPSRIFDDDGACGRARPGAVTRADFDGSEPVAVVNDTLAEPAFPWSELRAASASGSVRTSSAQSVWFTIVGVVKSTPTLGADGAEPLPKMYTLPMFTTQEVLAARRRDDLCRCRTSMPPAKSRPRRERRERAVDPNLALAQVRTLQDYLDAAAAPRAFTMILILIAASTALAAGGRRHLRRDVVRRVPADEGDRRPYGARRRTAEP